MSITFKQFLAERDERHLEPTFSRNKRDILFPNPSKQPLAGEFYPNVANRVTISNKFLDKISREIYEEFRVSNDIKKSVAAIISRFQHEVDEKIYPLAISTDYLLYQKIVNEITNNIEYTYSKNKQITQSIIAYSVRKTLVDTLKEQ